MNEGVKVCGLIVVLSDGTYLMRKNKRMEEEK